MPRKDKKYHYIYQTTCLVNGKYYIGMHSTDNLDDNYLGSGKSLKRSLNKYGQFAHSIEVLEFLPNRKLLAQREREIVTDDLLNDSQCMNLMIGGDGGLVQYYKEHPEILSQNGKKTLTQLWKDPEFRSRQLNQISKRNKELAKQSGSSNVKNYDKSFLGKNHTEESKRKIGKSISEKQKGNRNSQFGTCWITKDKHNKKIQKEDLDLYINLGWIKGRTL